MHASKLQMSKGNPSRMGIQPQSSILRSTELPALSPLWWSGSWRLNQTSQSREGKRQEAKTVLSSSGKKKRQEVVSCMPRTEKQKKCSRSLNRQHVSQEFGYKHNLPICQIYSKDHQTVILQNILLMIKAGSFFIFFSPYSLGGERRRKLH